MQFIDLKAQQLKIRKSIEKRINKVLDHGQYIMGPEVFELENYLATSVGTKYCVSVSSGTDALLILLMSKNIGSGDAVLTTPFTYIATAEVISLLGATPVFVDIYEKTFNLNPSKIEESIFYAKKRGLSPKAIISVDLFGLPARYRLIKEIAEKNQLVLIEDAAQAYGAKIRNKNACSFGHAAATSFFPSKPLGCYGDGGAIFTNDKNINEISKSIRIHGSDVNKYRSVRLGVNGRMDTIQASILLEKLQIFDDELSLRNKIAKRYSKKISNHYSVPYIPKDYQSSWAQYSILSPETHERNQIITPLQENKVPIMIYYPIPLHRQPVFNFLGYKKGDFPISEYVSEKIFSIPINPYSRTKEQDKIIDLLNDFL